LKRFLIKALFVPLFVFAGTLRAAALPDAAFELNDPGADFPVDYDRYGRFVGSGTRDFRYEIANKEGLAAAVGAGIYPSDALEQDQGFLFFRRSHQGKVDPWKFCDGPSARDNFYAWNLAEDADPGHRLFYAAENLRRAGHIRHAIKAYHALVVHFPRTVVWLRDGSFYWYAAPEAISRIRRLCAEYPELGVKLVGALVDVERAQGKDPQKDVVNVQPGKIVREAPAPVDLNGLQIAEKRGGKVRVVKFDNGHWQLQLNGRPFVVKGITYSCTRVGESPHDGSLRPWMSLDDNRNGKNDGMFDSWVDLNGNNRQDESEAPVGDARLLSAMGVNTVRYYHTMGPDGRYDPKEYDKEMMRVLHRDFGIRFILGDFLGAYTIGSGAPWHKGTDYTDAGQRTQMKDMVRSMVTDHKDEPYVLLWLLGNENQHPWTKTNADKYPVEYAKFVNEVAQMVKELDPEHPVGICQLAAEDIKILARHAPEVDIYGANVYAGPYSMGSTTQLVKEYYDRPLLFTEWGCDAYHQDKGPDEQSQAEYIRGNWKDIALNVAGGTGEGNVIGGVVFEWMDEWWKSDKDNRPNPASHQCLKGDIIFPFKDGWSHEEWLGIAGQGDGKHSPFLRRLRKAYSTLRDLWAAPPAAAEAAVPEAGEKGKNSSACDGVIRRIDRESGKLVMFGRCEGQADGGNREIAIRANVDEVVVSDVLNNALRFSDLSKGDTISAVCRASEPGLAGEILLLGVRQTGHQKINVKKGRVKTQGGRI